MHVASPGPKEGGGGREGAGFPTPPGWGITAMAIERPYRQAGFVHNRLNNAAKRAAVPSQYRRIRSSARAQIVAAFEAGGNLRVPAIRRVPVATPKYIRAARDPSGMIDPEAINSNIQDSQSQTKNPIHPIIQVIYHSKRASPQKCLPALSHPSPRPPTAPRAPYRTPTSAAPLCKRAAYTS